MGRSIEKTSVQTKVVSHHFVDSLAWIFPISVFVMSVLLIFFVIAGQVGYMKREVLMLSHELTALRTKVNKNTPASDASSKPIEAILAKENDQVKQIQAQFQDIDLAEKDYWQFALKSASASRQLSKPVFTKLTGNGLSNLLIVNYSLENYSSSGGQRGAFELFPYTDQEYAIEYDGQKYPGILIFVDDKMVMAHDFFNFKSLDKDERVKKLLSSIKQYKDVDEDLRRVAESELKSLN